MKIGTIAAALAFAVSGAASGDETSSIRVLESLLEQPVSSASKLEQTTIRAPGSVTVVTADDIAAFGYRSLAEILDSLEGFYLTYDRNYTYVGVRGFSRPSDYNNRILLLVDGHRLNEDVFGSAPLGADLPIDLGAIDRVEIVRGPGSASFGSSAMLAVINVRLRRAGSTSREVVALEAGDFGRFAASVRGAHVGKGNRGVAWSLFASQEDGPSLYFPEYDVAGEHDGRTRGTDWARGKSATLSASFGSFELTALGTVLDKGIPTAAFDVRFDDRRAKTRDAWSTLALDWHRELSASWRLTARGQLAHYDYDGTYPYEDGVYRDRTENRWWSSQLEAAWEPRADRRLLFGLDYRRNLRANYLEYSDGAGIGTAVDTPYRDAAVYAEQEFQASERLLLSCGLRWDDGSGERDYVSPRAALVFFPKRGEALKLVYGRSFRSPNVYEAAFAEPGLRPERLESVEAIWLRSWTSWLHSSASLYLDRIEHLIDQLPTDDPTEPNYGNLERASVRGIELALTARSARGVTAFLRAAAQESEDERTGLHLSNSPRRHVKLGLAAPLSRSWRVSGSLAYESERRTLAGDATDAATLAHATLRWQPVGRPFALELRVRNLFDTAYGHPGGFEHRQDVLAQDGRSLGVRLELRF